MQTGNHTRDIGVQCDMGHSRPDSLPIPRSSTVPRCSPVPRCSTPPVWETDADVSKDDLSRSYEFPESTDDDSTDCL